MSHEILHTTTIFHPQRLLNGCISSWVFPTYLSTGYRHRQTTPQTMYPPDSLSRNAGSHELSDLRSENISSAVAPGESSRSRLPTLISAADLPLRLRNRDFRSPSMSVLHDLTVFTATGCSAAFTYITVRYRCHATYEYRSLRAMDAARIELTQV